MKKQNHKNILQPLRSTIKIHKFIGFDIETIEIKGTHQFYFGSIVNDNFSYIFFDKDEFVEELLKRKYCTYTFVATNLNFDFLGLFSKHKEFNNFKKIFRGSNLLLCSLSKGKKGTIKFIDTFNYIQFSVKKLGSIIGVDKLHPPEYMGERDSRTFEELEYFIEYNIYDSYISYKFMEFLQKGTNELGGELKITIASSSLNVFRRKYLHFPIKKELEVLKDNEVDLFIREAYYGGRTEVFSKGLKTNVNYYDINSLYPSVMYKYKVPIPNSVKKVDTPCISNIINHYGVTRCRVIAPDIDKPLLPYRCPKSKKLLFPTGEFQGTYNNNELLKALQLGYKITPLQQIIYTRNTDMFKRYIDELYNLRLKYKKENSPMQLIVKLYMNSLYGKFGQYNKTESEILDTDYIEDEELLKDILLYDTLYDVKENIAIKNTQSVYDGCHALPIFSSYISSYARIELYNYLEKYDVIYCDTDSIVTPDTVPTSNKLGDMKLEGVLEYAEFYKPKMYTMKFLDEEDSIVKIKGIPKCNTQELQTLLNNGSVKRVKFSKLKESIRRGIDPNSVIEVDKKLSLQDTKRLWFGDISVPLYIQEEK